MPYFQNLFTSDFEGNWLLADRHHIPKFVCSHNAGRGDEVVVTWNDGPFDLSTVDSDSTNSTDTLEIVFALNNQKNWTTLAVDITASASSSSAVTSEEIVAALNADDTFNDWFIAQLGPSPEKINYSTKRVMISQKKPVTNFRFYINNGRAEEVLRFNARAGVAELPTYFARHTMDNRFVFDDCANMLVELDPSLNVHANIIDSAVNAKGNSLGYSSASVSEDWQLLAGRSGLFEFTHVIDSSNTIIYSAGAKVGDLAKKIVKDGNNIFVIPHTLQSGDLITPS
jgi:hypothetical protein